MTISKQIDKKQAKIILKMLKTKILWNQTVDTDHEDKEDDKDVLFATQSESTTTSDIGDNTTLY